MNLKGLYNSGNNVVVSFEVFPPKSIDLIENFYKELDNLLTLNPKLISLTYGAGGSNQERSLDIIKNIADKTNVMPHFTCVCASKDKVNEYINQISLLNIKNILALRGDEPENCIDVYNDFKYANELVSFIKSNSDLSVAVAGYPEGHIKAPNLTLDVEFLKKKVEKGADAIFTQMFFDNQKLFEYLDVLERKNIDIPVIAGIMPILNYSQINKFLSMAKVTLPKKLKNQLEKYQDDSNSIKEIGIDFASEQCEELISQNISGLHFYTLNKSYSTTKILNNLSLV